MNKRYRITCTACGSPCVDNEGYDFRVQMYKTEGAGIWVFIDDEVDTSGMICSNKECVSRSDGYAPPDEGYENVEEVQIEKDVR